MGMACGVMSGPSPEKLAQWRAQAAEKGAIVPQSFVVTPQQAEIICGNCGTKFVRNLILNLNNPTFVCPNESCGKKNWVPILYKLKGNPYRRR
jgi:hypothetical protein